MKALNIEICDVTLRDGEQTPGVSFTCSEKQEIAGMLDAIGVEVIEAGFPIVSENERECVKAITRMGLDARVCCLARARQEDIDAVLECDADIASIFIATSDRHIRYKYHCSRQEVTERALSMIDYARDHGLEVRFAAEDASRTDTSILADLYRAAAERGALYSSFADTVGCMTPPEMYRVISGLAEVVPNRICVHCHNDLGCATANTIMAAEAGAFQLHTTVNGIGERAGNASLEEVLTILRLKYGIDRYDLSLLNRISETVERISGLKVQKNKAIVGENAFSHESGIHIAALLEDPLTYEYVPPEMVGGERRFILGKHTGRHAIRHVTEKLGYELTPEEITGVLHEVKRRSEGKCSITPEVLLSIIGAVRREA